MYSLISASLLCLLVGAAGSVNAASLGVRVSRVPEALRHHLGVEGGALIVEVFPGSPAEKAGLERHDVVTSIRVEKDRAEKDVAIRGPDDLEKTVRQKAPGEELGLTVRRGVEELHLTVKLGEAPAEEDPEPRERGFLGVRFSAVPAVLRAHLEIEEGVGVVIDDVLEESAAAKAGLAEYDVVVSVDGAEVKASGPDIEVFPPDVTDRLPHPLHVKSSNFPRLIGERKEGDVVRLEVIHKAKRKEIQVTLAAKSGDFELPESPRIQLWRNKKWKEFPGSSQFRGKLFWRGPDGEDHEFDFPEFEWGPDTGLRLPRSSGKYIDKLLEEHLPKDLRERVKSLFKKYKPDLKFKFDFDDLDLKVPEGTTIERGESRISVIKRVDGDETITVRDENGRRTVSVKRKGEVLAEDLPIDDIGRLPEELQERVKKIAEELPDQDVKGRILSPKKRTIEIKKLGGLKV